MTSFDPEAFHNASIQGESATRFEPIPEGEYNAYIKGVAFRQFSSKDGEARTTMEVTWQIDNQELAKKLDREPERLTSRQTVWLDIDEKGGIATGKNVNVGLGRLREAVGQNKPGQAWSPRNLEAAGPCLIFVKHRAADDGTVYDGVQKVTALNAAPSKGKAA